MWLKNVIIKDNVIENERLELGDKDALYYLGPNLTLRQCTLVIKVPTRRLLLLGPQFMGCTIDVKKELKNFPWYEASLKNCRLIGRFSGNDFGHRPGSTSSDATSGIEACDFTEAILDACRFIGCDVSTLRFPKWPCFTLLSPYERRRELAAFKWPGEVRFAMDFSRGPESIVAVTYWATALAKQFGTTEAELKTVIGRMNGVIY
jgi:hypothetical protein